MRQLKDDFPLFAQRPQLVYLDSAATAQKPQVVIDAVRRHYERDNANVHRGLYTLSAEATAAYEGARDTVARFVGARDPRGVVFTRNCTEAINLVAYGWGRARLGPGDEILTTVLEHHSNLVPWQQAARATGATLRVVPMVDGRLDLEQLEQMVGRATRLVAVTGLSNVLGTVTPLQPVVRAARRVGARVLVDGAQLVMHREVDFDAAGIDFFALSGHKLLGPTGVGALVARPELLEQMEPFLTGGEMVLDVTLERATWNEIPHRFEAGTPPVAQAVGLAAAMDYLQQAGMVRLQEHDRALRGHGLRVLTAVDGLQLYSPSSAQDGAVATFTFNLFDRQGRLIHPHDVGTVLAAKNIAVRAGHHCAKPLMRLLGVPATVRASAYLYNTTEDLDALAAGLREVRDFFSG